MSEQLSLEEIFQRIADEIENSTVTGNKDLDEYRFHLTAGGTLEELIKEKLNEYEPEGIERANPNVEVMSFDSGGEGSAEDAPEFVFKYKPTGQLVGTNGWYASYHGTDWDEGFSEYKEVPTVVYRPK